MFDTPVILPKRENNKKKWWYGPPTFEDYNENVLSIQPHELVNTMR